MIAPTNQPAFRTDCRGLQDCASPRHARHAGGFTLLEMILALSIGLVLMISLYNVLSMQVQQSETGRRILNEGTLARSIFTKMTSDILSNLGAANPTATATASSSTATATATTDPSTTPMATGDSTITFNNGVYGNNTLLILTACKVPQLNTADPTQQASVCDLRRISYWLVNDGANSGLAWQELAQATGNDLTSIPPDVPAGTYELLATEVKDLLIQYFDGVNWQDSWDGTTLGGPNADIPVGPPSAIAITLTFSRRGPDGADLPDDQLPKYKHVVAIPAGNNFPSSNP
jgi:prepilin-type N-terminal cleavage/methylation domain-containing protein